MNEAEIVQQIDKLVAEEHHLERDHGERELSDRSASGWIASKSSSISAGTCCASGGPGATPGRTRPRPRCGRPTWWSATSNDRDHGEAGGRGAPGPGRRAHRAC